MIAKVSYPLLATATAAMAMVLVSNVCVAQGKGGKGVLSTNPDDVHFYHYFDKNELNRKEELLYGNVTSLKRSHFTAGAPVILHVHGYHTRHESQNGIKDAYLESNFVNVVLVDWPKLAATESMDIPNVVKAAINFLSVEKNGAIITGRRVCQMILFLIKEKYITGPNQVHLLGHSLGAHVAGVAGRCVKQRTGKLVGRITGLDPGLTIQTYFEPDNRLDESDAAFVDIIHTAVGQGGSGLRLGTVDFYANGGVGLAQPNCLNATLDLGAIVRNLFFGACAHGRSYLHYVRSIRQTRPELYGCRCVPPPIDIFILPTPHCIKQKGICSDMTLFGEYVPKTARGTFYLDVGDLLPGLGDTGPLG